MLRKSIILILLSFSMAACTATQSSLKKRLLIGWVPQFNEYISPMTVPVQPMYRPCVFKFKSEMAANFYVTENSSTEKVNQYIKMEGKCKIQKLGDMLTWDLIVNKVVTNNETIAPNHALVQARMLTDMFGKIQEIEATSPALSSNIEQEKIDKFVKSMKQSIKKISAGLPENPVRSGDSIIKINKSSLLAMEPEFQNDIKMDGEIAYIIKGWSFFNGKKVIVASMYHVITTDIDGVEIQMIMNGYNLYDPKTFQVVEGYLLLVISPLSGGNKFSGKLLFHQSSIL